MWESDAEESYCDFVVAIANVRQAQATSSSSDLMTSSSTTTVTSFVHPTWLFGTAIENGGPQAFQTAYLIPGCNTATDPRKCIVKGGVNWVSMTGGNMQEQEYVADVQSQTVSGWSFVAMIIFTAVLVAITWGAATTFSPALANAALAANVTTTTIAAAGAAAYAGVTMAISGSACLGCVQGQWGGQLASAYAAPSAGGFGDPSAAIHNNFVSPGVGGALQGGQAAMVNQQKPKTWADTHDPSVLIANPPLRSGVMNGYVASPL